MSYTLIKAAARRLGLYRQARRFHRRVMNRDLLQQFRAECAFYAPFIRPGDLCFDVGANFGAKTEVFLALGARVVAFEPQPDCCEENRARNPQATIVPRAVGSTAGTLLLHVGRARTDSSLLPDWPGPRDGVIEVSVTTLDAAVAEYGLPVFCKSM
jgi:FkbM family methyltransferase